MNKIIEELKALVWTLAGTGLVLITLSGKTKTLGWTIAVSALALSIVIALLKSED